MLLKGKKVVVVGGSSGIGLATAELAKGEGADVIIASRNVERLDAAANRLNAVAIPADVTSDESVTELFRRCGAVDHVVVTAARATRHAPQNFASMVACTSSIATVLNGPVRSCAAVTTT